MICYPEFAPLEKPVTGDDVRGTVKRIMEGGEAAFNLRKANYGS